MGGSLPEDRQDPLHRACAGGSLDEVKALIARRHDLHARDEWQRTLLHVAAEHSTLEMIEYLVEEASLDVLAIDQFGESLLHVAVRRGDPRVIEYLLDKGVDEAPLVVCPNRSSMGHSAQKFDSCPEDVVVLAARHATLEVVRTLLCRGFILDPQNKHQRPLVSAAITRGDVDMLDLFARSGFSLFATDAFGTSMMVLAAKHGSTEVLDYFINQGVYEDEYVLLRAAVEGSRLDNIKSLVSLRLNLHTTDRYGKTLLQVAIETASPPVIEYLLRKHVTTDAATTQGKTLLYSAIERGDLAILKFLLSEGVVAIDEDAKANEELLRLAVRSNDKELVEFLIDAGVEVTATKDKNGYSSMHLAIWRNNLKMVKMLEARGLQLEICESSEKPLLRLAIAHASLPLIEHLVAKGLDLEAVNEAKSFVIMDADEFDLDEDQLFKKSLGRKVTQADSGHFSLLHAAVQRGDFPVVQYLVDQGMDLNVVDKLGRSLLHLATIQDSFEVVDYLVSLEVRVDTVDKKGKTPLHHAVRQGNLKILTLFVRKGVDLLAIDENGPALLPKAVKRSHWLMTEYLLGQGLKLNAVDKEGNSLLKIAVSCGSKRMVDFLIDRGSDLKTDGDELLVLAAKNQDMDLLAHLVDKGLDLRACDDKRNSLLHVAIRQHVPPDAVNLKLISYLCAMKVDVNTINIRNNTPLHIASELGDLESAKLLLENGAFASVATRNDEGLLPIEIACRNLDPPLVRALIEAGSPIGTTILGVTLSTDMFPIRESELEALYSTARLLCKHGAVWNDACDATLVAWPSAQMETLLTREWSKDSTFSSGQESDAGHLEFGNLDHQEESALIEQELRLALALRCGVRACVRLWNKENQVTGEASRLSDVPLEILLRGERAVETYLTALEATGVDDLQYRRKVCVAGPTKSGKTSLIRSLLASQPTLASEGDRTIGIDLAAYSFVEENKTSVRCHDVTFWDFAGQDVYHGAHAVFFSRRTLYFVCIDLSAYADELKEAEEGPSSSERLREVKLNRFVDRSVFKWLRLIFARQPDGEIVIVGTKADKIKGQPQALEEIQRDFELRLSTWKRKLECELDQSSSELQARSSMDHTKMHMKQLKEQVTKLIATPWLVVSSTSEEDVEHARRAVEEAICCSPSAFAMPSMYARAMETIEQRRDAAAQRLDGKERIESVFMPVNALCKLLLREVAGLDTESCLAILRTLHDLGEILWYEDSGAGPLQDMVILDPCLVMDIIREVVNHERVDESAARDPASAVSEDGVMPHALLVKCHLWRYMDRELFYAFKSLLQYFQVAYSADNQPMDWDSDLVVPTYWKSQQEPLHPLPLLQQQSSIQRRGVTPSVYLTWEYEIPAEISELLFEQLAVESYTPLFRGSAAWHNCIESTVEGEFASRIEIRQGETLQYDAVRVEVAAENESSAWRYLRFYVMAMETVLDRYPGLVVTRCILATGGQKEVRFRVSDASKAFEDALKMGHDDKSVREMLPWVPADFSWFIEKAWRDPEILQRLRTRELVRQTVNKVDVLRHLVVAGDKRRRMPALWMCEYQKDTSKIVIKILSDLSGICFHVPIEIDVPTAFLAQYGAWLQNGLSVCSNVVPKLLSQPVLQKVFDLAETSLAQTVERAQQVHNLIDRIDFGPSSVFDSSGEKLPPGVAMQMLMGLLKLHDATFDELQISAISNLECAATVDDGYFIWAHRHEILQLKGLVEICDPSAQLTPQTPIQSSLPSTQHIQFRMVVVNGLDAWDWRQTFCEWQLFYGERQTPIESGKTTRHEDPTTEPSWNQWAPLVSVTSAEMLHECRVSIQVKRPSRLLGKVKTLHEGTLRLQDAIKQTASTSMPLKIDSIIVPLDNATPPKRSLTCSIQSA